MATNLATSMVIGSAVLFSQLAAVSAVEPTAGQQLVTPQKETAGQQISASDAAVTETKSGTATKTAAPKRTKQPKQTAGAIEVLQPKFTLNLSQGFSKVIRTKQPVIRVAVPSPEIVEVVAFQRNEVGVMGKSPGVTTVTLWIGTKEKSEAVQILVRVRKNVARQDRRR